MTTEPHGWIDFDIAAGSTHRWSSSSCYCCLSGERVIAVSMTRLRVKIAPLSSSVLNRLSFLARHDILVSVPAAGRAYRTRHTASSDVVCSSELERIVQFP